MSRATTIYQTSLSGSVINTVTYTRILKTVPVKCHGDDTPLTFHDTHLFSLLILLGYVSKFNVHDTLITLPLRLALPTKPSQLPACLHKGKLASKLVN